MSRKNGGIIGPANTPVGGLFKGVAGGVWRMNDVANFVGNSQWPSTPQSIDNSCRFDRASGDYLSRTPSSAGNRKIFTFSTWLKGHDAAVQGSSYFFHADISGSSNVDVFGLTATGIQVSINSANSGDLNTTAVFRDLSAWYHMVFAVDTTQGTASNRLKIYVNGTQITAFDTETYPSQDYQFTGFNTTQEHNVSWADSEHNGYLAETVFIDGQQLEPTSFGEFDTTTGIWKPKKIGSFSSAGTNSFYLDFKDSSNLGKDASGLGNNFTVTNIASTDQMTDTCVENFATLNSLNNVGTGANPTYSEGNLKVVSSADNYFGGSGNIGVTTGKWYLEVELDAESTSGQGVIGMSTNIFEEARQNRHLGQLTSNPSVGYYGGNGNKVVDGATDSSYGNTYAAGDIIGIAIDLDNNKIYFSKNGTFQNSGDPTSGSTGTGAISLTATDREWFLTLGDAGSSTTATYLVNFGNPPFSISSGNSDANGHGNFEYSVPSGYYALNTSNLNTYG